MMYTLAVGRYCPQLQNHCNQQIVQYDQQRLNTPIELTIEVFENASFSSQFPNIPA